MSDRHERQRTPRRWPGALLVAVGGPIVRRLFPVRVEGDEHLPATGPAIIAANHLSFFDHVALVLSVGRRLNFVGKSDYLDSWKTRFVLPALGMIPVDRDNPRRALGALEQAADVLRADELFAIYPEGTRSRDGSLHAGHTGVGHLSAATGVSIVPTGIVGTNRIQPPGARFPRPFRTGCDPVRHPDRSSELPGDPSPVSATDHQRRDAGHRRTHTPEPLTAISPLLPASRGLGRFRR